ncbi:hypothetical protein BKA80DRAFT_112067 [Phyllosticta citrichinensis]
MQRLEALPSFKHRTIRSMRNQSANAPFRAAIKTGSCLFGLRHYQWRVNSEDCGYCSMPLTS